MGVVNASSVAMVAGDRGEWRIDRIAAVRGEPLAPARALRRMEGPFPESDGAAWVLRGVRSNERYTIRVEKDRLAAKSPDLGRVGCEKPGPGPGRHARGAAPHTEIRGVWQLPQDERRAIFEESSRHISIGLEYVPGVARRLYHCRDLGEPFDFLTWFEFAPGQTAAFDDLVGRLRETEEWRYVEREVDVRLSPE